MIALNSNMLVRYLAQHGESRFQKVLRMLACKRATFFANSAAITAISATLTCCGGTSTTEHGVDQHQSPITNNEYKHLKEATQKVASEAPKDTFPPSKIYSTVIEKRLGETINLPEQNLRDRINFLNQLLINHGFAQKNVTVVCDSSISAEDFLCHNYHLKNPTIRQLLACSMERYIIMYHVSAGEIRFMKMTMENIEKDRDSDHLDRTH